MVYNFKVIPFFILIDKDTHNIMGDVLLTDLIFLLMTTTIGITGYFHATCSARRSDILCEGDGNERPHLLPVVSITILIDNNIFCAKVVYTYDKSCCFGYW